MDYTLPTEPVGPIYLTYATGVVHEYHRVWPDGGWQRDEDDN
jgi:hypothetical protein